MMLVVVAAIASCEKQPTFINEAENEVIVIEPVAETYTYIIKASVFDEAVKSDYNSTTGAFTWSSGDAISVLFHKDKDNQFFTLTTTGTGESATFTGEITSGYEIGASDGTVSDKKIWALFPASTSHTYTEGALPSFYVQPEVDFSATHFSANVPMYALNAAEGALSFTNLACTFKFIVNGIKDGVSKVRFTVHNQTTFGLSGLWSLYEDGAIFVNYSYATPGSEKSTLSYVSDVTSNQAVFYVSCHGTFGTFQPNITITNCATGLPIKVFTASKSITYNDMTTIKPITLNVSEASGGDYFVPAINIDGVMSDWNPATNAALTNGTNYEAVAPDGSYWKEFKVAYDERYIYFYAKRNYTAELWTGGGYFWFKFDTDLDDDYDDNKKFYISPFTTSGVVYTFASNPAAKDVSGTASASFSLNCAGTYDASVVEVEVAALRSDIGINKNDVFGVLSNANKSAGNITLSNRLTINN